MMGSEKVFRFLERCVTIFQIEIGAAMKTKNGRHNLALFAVAILNLGVVMDCLLARIPISYVSYSITALIATLFLAFVSFDLRESRYMSDIRGALALPRPKEFEEVAKRIRRFGPEGEHPQLTRAEWMRAIASDETQDSYWEWVTKREMFVNRLVKAISPQPGEGIGDIPTGDSGLESTPVRRGILCRFRGSHRSR